MSTQTELDRLNVQEFARRFRGELIPLSNTFSYFSVLPLSEEDIKDYLEEPTAALPPAIPDMLGKIAVLLVPFLEKPNGKGLEVVTFERPAAKSQTASAQFTTGTEATLIIGIKEREVADYHYVFYHALASLIAEKMPVELDDAFLGILRDEFTNRVHGEVDEEGWQLKQSLLRRQTTTHRETKLYRSYARQAFIDSFTLYMHGICCDIDVETGPRQLPSRFLRRRLELLHTHFPPPAGYAVFPEELK